MLQSQDLSRSWRATTRTGGYCLAEPLALSVDDDVEGFVVARHSAVLIMIPGDHVDVCVPGPGARARQERRRPAHFRSRSYLISVSLLPITTTLTLPQKRFRSLGRRRP